MDGSMMLAGAAAANNGPGFCHYLGRPMAARYLYTVLFLLANILAGIACRVTYFQRQRLSGCQGDRNCLQAEAVLLISMTAFLFFSFMSLINILTTKLQDLGNSCHSKCWFLKCFLLSMGVLFISTLVPTDWVQLYGSVAPIGAGAFINIQMISVIRYITRLYYKWCHTNYEQRKREVVFVSFLAYSASAAGIILMMISYAHSRFNTVLISTTLLLVCLMPFIALKSKGKGPYMEPALLGVYILFLCWSAIRSEPETSGYQKLKAKTMISFVFELISIVVAAFSTGSDYKCLQFGDTVESEDDIPYGYAYFHFIFAMGSMYFGMLFVGWDTHHIMGEWNVDVGWICTWVHMIHEALVVIFFVAILIARTCEIGWLRKILVHIFGIGGQLQGGDQSQNMELEMDTGLPPSPLPHIPDPASNI